MVRTGERGGMHLRATWIGWIARTCAFACLGGALGCSAYDAALLHAGSSGGGLRGNPPVPSTGTLQRACREADNNDGCCPAGMGPAQDADCGSCGDGVIGPLETCDPPGTCPTAAECMVASKCIQTEFSGSPEQCNARCEVKPVRTCRAGDGCCPSNCDTSRDSDCSSDCGDGIVDLEHGETCEPNSQQTRCPESCDDGDSCTLDLGTGSAATCSMACSHTRITAPQGGDGCCPPGAHALNDSDCAPRCGNGVVEAGEQCDGGMCNTDCTMPSDQQRCLGALGPGACSECACSRCATPMLNCYDSGDETRDARCQPVVECALQERCLGACRPDDAYGCFGQWCWCGTALCPPIGPCRAEIAGAAQSTVSATVSAHARNPDYALYDAEQYGACLRTQCAAACGL